jgi:hypothetical protein
MKSHLAGYALVTVSLLLVSESAFAAPKAPDSPARVKAAPLLQQKLTPGSLFKKMPLRSHLPGEFAAAVLWTNVMTVGPDYDIETSPLVVGPSGDLFQAYEIQGQSWVSRRDSEGNVIWKTRFNQDHITVIWFLALDKDTNVCVAGWAENPGSGPQDPGNGPQDFMTGKLDPNGNVLWIACHSTLGQWNDFVTGLAVDPSGNVYVTGTESYSGVVTIKYSPQGQQLWLQRDTRCLGSGLALDTAGNVIVIGAVPGDGYDWMTIKYNPDGQQLWAIRYGSTPTGSESRDDSPRAVAVDAAGNIYVAGTAQPNPDYEYQALVIKYAPEGTELWKAFYRDPVCAESGALAMHLDRANNVYVMGKTDRGDPDNEMRYAIVKFGPDGHRLWVSRLFASHEGGGEFAVDRLGQSYLTATLPGQPTATLSYDANGCLRWAMPFPSGQTWSDHLDKIAICGTDRVVASGVLGQNLSTICYQQVLVKNKPRIMSTPQNRTVAPGSTALFNVVAFGKHPLHYQWYFEKTPIPNAANAVPVLPNVQAAAAGYYSVTVSNPWGWVRSPDAELSVATP